MLDGNSCSLLIISRSCEPISPLIFERTYRAEHTHYTDDLPVNRELAAH